MRHSALRLAPFVLAAAVAPNAALAAPRFVIGEAERVEGSDAATVEVLLLNDGADEEQVTLPPRVQASLGGAPLWLDRAPETPASVTIAPKGFARIAYRFTPPAGMTGPALVSIPEWSTQTVALAAPQPTRVASSTPAGAEPVRTAAALTASDGTPLAAADGTAQTAVEERFNGFFGNLSAYQPMYVAYGTAEDSELRVQLSFKYQVLGRTRKNPEFPAWSDGLYLGYTQKILWNLESDADFRDSNYMPELFFRTPAMALGSNGAAGLQLGVLHESNGRSGGFSRSLNSVYVAPTAMWNLGNGYSVTAAPRLTFLFGGKAGNPDIRAYRGVTGLDFQIGKDDGLKLATHGRYNFSSGRGGLETELSYPLSEIFGGGPEFYLFVQNFTGYGESLIDYDRKMTRLRFGIAITR
ncbi:phospholipase A [Sphingomonas zeicaulis]|uniref:phospholipase A n=1 Tax=Sphingomonas zeicaulis TaxID=1632740 RepID=UPI003D21B29D